MEGSHYITVTQFCRHYGVEHSFVSALQQSGLIQWVEEEEPLIPVEQLTDLEKYTRLHYELEINPEGIEAITYLLQRMSELEKELQQVKARLRLYEGDEK